MSRPPPPAGLPSLLSELGHFLCRQRHLYAFSNVKILLQPAAGEDGDGVSLVESVAAHWGPWLRPNTRWADIKRRLKQPDRDESGEPFGLLIAERHRLQRQIGRYVGRCATPTKSEEEENDFRLSSRLRPRLSPKKLHEVERLCAHLGFACRQAGLRHVVDIGAGLGYLGLALADPRDGLGLSVTSVEAQAGHAETAAERLAGDGRQVRVVRARLESGPAGHELLSQLLPDSDGEDNAPASALVGLHCCGDLTPTMLRLFAEEERLRVLCVASCCYQKMSDYHPMSQAGRDLLSSLAVDQAGQLTSHFARRLASQEPFEDWLARSDEEHLKQSRLFGYRAVMEQVVRAEDVTVTKKKRRAVPKGLAGCRVMETCTALEDDTLLNDILDRYSFRHASMSEEDVRRRIVGACAKKGKELFPVLELITGLQLFLQNLLEYFILLDRLLYLHEQGFTSARIGELFDARLSPRNKVIVCTK